MDSPSNVLRMELVEFKKKQSLTYRELSNILKLKGPSCIWEFIKNNDTICSKVFDPWYIHEIKWLQSEMGLSKNGFYRCLGIETNQAKIIEKMGVNADSRLNFRFYLYSALVNWLLLDVNSPG